MALPALARNRLVARAKVLAHILRAFGTTGRGRSDNGLVLVFFGADERWTAAESAIDHRGTSIMSRAIPSLPRTTSVLASIASSLRLAEGGARAFVLLRSPVEIGFAWG
jgi:hypothetical protein